MRKPNRKKPEVPDFLKSESGVSAVEYALLTASVLIIVAGLLSSDIVTNIDALLSDPETQTDQPQSASEGPYESL